MPAAAVTSVESLCNLLNRSRLVKPADVQGLYKTWRGKEAKGGAAELQRFIPWLVSQHYVTQYQAKQLSLGLVDQFYLNHYRLLDFIGKGRMAGIFKASHSLGHIVAVKVMPAAKAQDQQILARFRREAKMAARLKHPNIVRTHHLGNANGRHYIVMDYLEGETLEDVLKRRKKLPYGEAARLIHQALLALQHVHEQNMVHRDLTPGNLMLVPPRPPGAPDTTLYQTVKLLDIGMGRVLFDENATGDSINMQLTSMGMMLGTAEYMAPEQGKDPHNVTIRADIYGLGCVLYHALAGQPPFTDKSGFDVLIKHVSTPPRPIRELEPTVPEGLQIALDAMLAKNPMDRPASPDVAARSLTAFLPGGDQGPPPISSLVKSYEKWVASQPLEETSGAPVVADKWYYSRNGLSIGPVPRETLTQLAIAGKLGPADLLWMDGDKPDLAIPAKAAIDFSNLKVQTKAPEQRHTQQAAKVTPPAAAAPVSAPPVQLAQAPTAAALLDSGFNADTGQIIDAAKFAKWQKAEQAKKQASAAAAPSVGEVYEKARIHLDRWLDFDRNRRPILAGDMDFIRQDPDIVRFMSYHSRYGAALIHKLWNHLQFMVENRRKYYCALGG